MYGPVYDRLAPSVQSALVSVRGLLRRAGRASAGTATYARMLARCESMSRAELREWQAAALADVLDHAARHVPFYAGMSHCAARDYADVFVQLREWPLLDKQVVKRDERLLLSDDAKLKMPAWSSGSTGSPTRTWRTPRAIAYEQALIERQLGWAGWRRGQRRAWIRGDPVVPLSATRPPYWRHNAAERMLMCSSFHLSEASAPNYVEAIEAFDPVIIQAYPSAIAFLARWLVGYRRRYAAPSLLAVVTSSERVTDEMRRVCQQAFGVPVFDWYGLSERVAAIGTCEHGRYHLIEDAAYVELMPEPDGSASIVGTAFANRAMPLIRYRTGDRVQPARPGERCRCDRPFRLVDAILGRETDAIVTADGREHVMLDFVFDRVAGLQQAQIVQDEPDAIDIFTVLRPGIELGDIEVVRRRAMGRLGPRVQVRLHRVASIPRNAAGKSELIVNRLARRSSSAGGSPL